MTSRVRLRPSAAAAEPFDLIRVSTPSPEINRYMYVTVGNDWWWYYRRSWDYARWLAYVDREALQTWVAYVAGAPAGFFELERQEGDNVEIAIFGLLPRFAGRRLGGPLLTACVNSAWDLGAARVWVHTCDLDHPHALSNYLARGFSVFKVERNVEQLPDAPLEL